MLEKNRVFPIKRSFPSFPASTVCEVGMVLREFRSILILPHSLNETETSGTLICDFVEFNPSFCQPGSPRVCEIAAEILFKGMVTFRKSVLAQRITEISCILHDTNEGT